MITSLVKCGAVKFGNFTLRSGKTSNVYIDIRTLCSFPRLRKHVSRGLANILSNPDNSVVCGVPTGGVPFACGVSDFLEIPMIQVRKASKSHGLKRKIEGKIGEGTEVVLIEDVITSGTSVLEIIDILVDEGIKIREVVVVMDREEGGKDKIESERGIPVKSLFKMSDLENFHVKLHKLISTRMEEKGTNVIFSADLQDVAKCLKLIDSVGPFVLGVKIHIGVFPLSQQTSLIEGIKALKKKHKLLIIDDSKHADIGSIVRKKLLWTQQWADLTTMHGISGPGQFQSVVDLEIGILLIHTMSCKGNLITQEYSEKVKDLAMSNPNVAGFICQGKVMDGFFHFTPGVSLSAKKDGFGQVYNSPGVMRGKGTDVFIIGRGIYNAEDPVEEVKKYRSVCYSEAVEKK